MATKTKKTTRKKTTNSEIVDRAVRHAIYLERLKNSEASSVVDLIRQFVVPALVQRIENSSESTLLQQAVGSTIILLQRMVVKLNERAAPAMLQLAKAEATWQASVIRSAIPLEVSLVPPNLPRLEQIAFRPLFDRGPAAQWYSELPAKTAESVQKVVKQSLAAENSVEKTVEALKGKSEDFTNVLGEGGELERNAKAITRTAISQVSADAREEVFKENTDVIDKVQMVATLDTRTSPYCQSIDGQIFEVGVGPRPPFHWGCRTVAVPVTKSWKDLGFKFKDTTPKQRASMDGEVPATLTYPDWLAKQSDKVQDDVLGPTRAALYRSGKVEIDRFVDGEGRQLTLKELARREGFELPD